MPEVPCRAPRRADEDPRGGGVAWLTPGTEPDSEPRLASSLAASQVEAPVEAPKQEAPAAASPPLPPEPEVVQKPQVEEGGEKEAAGTARTLPELEVIEVEGMPEGSISVCWGRNDTSHISAGRVELQVWHVEGGELRRWLDREPAAGCLRMIRLASAGPTVAGSPPVLFGEVASAPGFDDPGEAFGMPGAPLHAYRLLKQRLLPAHLGSIKTTAPIVLEGLPSLTGIALRARVYASAVGQGDRSRRNAGQPKNRCGSWGPPLFVVRLPADGQPSPGIPDESASAALRLAWGAAGGVPQGNPDALASVNIQPWR